MNSIKITIIENGLVSDVLKRYYISQKKIAKLIKDKKVFVSGRTICQDENVNTGDVMEIANDVVNIIPYKKKIKILYENDFVIVVNKPIGILVHSDGNTYETLQNAVFNYLLSTKKIRFCQAIHRLDYDTSGIVVFAKNFLALSFLSHEVENDNIYKKYICLTQGKFSNKKGIIDSKISKDRHSSKQVVNKNGKMALTQYSVVDCANNISKVEVVIKHGRRHQIRVHLASIGHPIIGDRIYGDETNEQRLMLHFKEINFTDPTDFKQINIQCNEDF